MAALDRLDLPSLVEKGLYLQLDVAAQLRLRQRSVSLFLSLPVALGMPRCITHVGLALSRLAHFFFCAVHPVSPSLIVSSEKGIIVADNRMCL